MTEPALAAPPEPRPGIYPGLSFAEYLAIRAVNHSILKLFAKSAMHAREEMLHPSPPTESQDFGQGFHAAVLEPDRFTEEYAVLPKVNRRTNAGKKEWADFEAAHQGFTFMKPDDYYVCRGMMDAVWQHESLGPLMQLPARSELSIVWRDKLTSVLCKARIDRMIQVGSETLVPDFKTTTDATAWEFAGSVAKYGYHTAGAFYLGGLDTLAPRQRRHVLIAIEKKRPHGVAMYELDQVALEQGRDECQKYLREYKAAIESGIWPGYPSEIQQLALPRWAIRSEEWQT